MASSSRGQHDLEQFYGVPHLQSKPMPYGFIIRVTVVVFCALAVYYL